MHLKQNIHAVIYPDDESGYVAVCSELHAVTQGDNLDETLFNLKEAIELALHGEDLGELGFVPSPTILITMEVEPAVA